MKKILFILSIFLILNFIIFPEEGYYIDWNQGRIYSLVYINVKGDNNFANNSLEGIYDSQLKSKINSSSSAG